EITEFELAPGMPYDLDLGVIGTVAGAVDSIQEQIGQAATYESDNAADAERFINSLQLSP
ncbi:MAG: hypothetical protein OEW83_18815, partial [Acidimicrobiia bacterium]|nr:hypothetical protein [Acidimicrobiia bacterium]